MMSNQISRILKSRVSTVIWVGVLWSGLSGCAPRFVGLKEGLRAPSDLSLNKVGQDRDETEKAAEIYRQRSLGFGREITIMVERTRDTGTVLSRRKVEERPIVLRGGNEVVSWKEIFDNTGLEKEAKHRYTRQRALRISLGTSLFVSSLLSGVGGFILLGQPGVLPGWGSLGLFLASIGCLLTGPWALGAGFGLDPKFSKVRFAVRKYNEKLRKALGLRKKGGAKGRGSRGPVCATKNGDAKIFTRCEGL